jgi:hypothetical protein
MIKKTLYFEGETRSSYTPRPEPAEVEGILFHGRKTIACPQILLAAKATDATTSTKHEG